jgi:uncharacterized protein YrzB (UPF0473 family)
MDKDDQYWLGQGIPKGVVIKDFADLVSWYGRPKQVMKYKDTPEFMSEYKKVFKKDEMQKQVYEYVAYYIAPKDEKEKKDTIILSDKLIAESEEAVKTKVIRLVPTEWENEFANITIKVRVFR